MFMKRLLCWSLLGYVAVVTTDVIIYGHTYFSNVIQCINMGYGCFIALIIFDMIVKPHQKQRKSNEFTYFDGDESY